MRVLLDTHVLLWALATPRLLSSRAAEILASETNVVVVSAASAWEIATKVRLGKLPGANLIERDFVENLRRAGFVSVPIQTEVALRAGRLAGEHRDPFDRMLAAQCLADDMAIVSADAKLDQFLIRRIW